MRVLVGDATRVLAVTTLGEVVVVVVGVFGVCTGLIELGTAGLCRTGGVIGVRGVLASSSCQRSDVGALIDLTGFVRLGSRAEAGRLSAAMNAWLGIGAAALPIKGTPGVDGDILRGCRCGSGWIFSTASRPAVCNTTAGVVNGTTNEPVGVGEVGDVLREGRCGTIGVLWPGEGLRS